MSEFQQVVEEGAQKIGRSAKRIAKRVVLALLLLSLIGAAGFFWVSNWTYSDGTRAGILIKTSRKGVVWKTYEGQLNLGGFSIDGQAGIGGSVWDFSIPKKAVYQKLQSYEGRRVKLHYRQVYRPMPWQGKTDYFVTDVQPVTEAK